MISALDWQHVSPAAAGLLVLAGVLAFGLLVTGLTYLITFVAVRAAYNGWHPRHPRVEPPVAEPVEVRPGRWT